jgi:hypothetical protein
MNEDTQDTLSASDMEKIRACIAEAKAAWEATQAERTYSSRGGIHVGVTYVFFVPPGWLLGGTVKAIVGDHVILENSVYLEGVQSGKATVSDLPAAKTHQGQDQVVRTCWPMTNGTGIRYDAILFMNPCETDMRGLFNRASAEAINNLK